MCTGVVFTGMVCIFIEAVVKHIHKHTQYIYAVNQFNNENKYYVVRLANIYILDTDNK